MAMSKMGCREEMLAAEMQLQLDWFAQFEGEKHGSCCGSWRVALGVGVEERW